MITVKDIQIANDSPIKKDFYQIYPELIEWVKELTDVWDPESTNESDPGTILLKIATFVADKLNYNVDKNILEAFITSATQEEAVRKICDMLGYNIKYYNSATTEVNFMWTGEELEDANYSGDIIPDAITLDAFSTKLTNESGDIIYTLTSPITLNRRYVTVVGTAIEGDVVDLEINDDNILKAWNLDNKNRFYLPEISIAENGIWIFNIKGQKIDENAWTRVDNLNTEIKGSKVWKFGFDSKLQTPYIQFPDDIVSLLEDGLMIKYARTNGKNGNIKADTLIKLQDDTLYLDSDANEENAIEDVEDKLIIRNISATNNGCDNESIDDAYNSYKKTVGTFDTLTTCRDYANAIYKMVYDEKLNNTPLTSNCQVSDIRNDLNFADKIIKYGAYGTYYENEALTTWVETTGRDPESQESIDVEIEQPYITDFDLILYPLNAITNAYTEDTFVNSFKPLTDNTNAYASIKTQLLPYKTISHKIKRSKEIRTKEDKSGIPNIYLYKNYYRLKAKIITNNKVNAFEQEEIRQNIFDALYRNFNPKQLEYGEEIPYDRLLDIMQKADARIKFVNLDEPEIQSYYMGEDGIDRILYNEDSSEDEDWLAYERMVAKNVLAGRVELFDYNKDIKPQFNGVNYSSESDESGGSSEYDRSYGAINKYNDGNITIDKCSITYATTNLTIPVDVEYKLNENESLQIIAPKLTAEETYPMYVNYYFNAGSDSIESGEAIAHVVEQNIPYQLQGEDVLYINYTDEDDLQYWITYTWDNENKCGKKVTIKNGVQTTEKFSGIIQSNFTIKDSSQVGQNWAKTKDKATNWPTSWTIPGLYSLKTVQEISIMNYAKSKLTSADALVFWVTNNNNQLKFDYTGESDGNNGEYRYFGHILEDGEYFFYTNSAKTDLVTFGSGTWLIIREKTNSDTITWRYNGDNDSIDLNEVADKGIGAFSDIDWITKHFNDEVYLIAHQMEIRSLVEDDTIYSISLSEGSYSEIDSSKWWELEELSYSGGEIKSTEAQKWIIRPILNLNIGPSKNQVLQTNHEITFYTSIYTDKDTEKVIPNNDIYNYLKYSPNKVVEEIAAQVPVITYSGLELEGCALRANLNIQKVGGTFISLHTVEINASKYDNLTVYLMDVSDNNSAIQVIDKNDQSRSITEWKIDFSSYKSATLPIFIPEGNYNIISLYYSAEDDSYKIKVKVDGNATIKEFKDLFNSGESGDNNELILKRGLHHIIVERISGQCKLIISEPEESGSVPLSGTAVTIVTNKLVKDDESTKGLNNSVLKLNKNRCADFFNDKIAIYPDFYCSCDIENSMLLDFKDLSDPYCLFSYNNMMNDFVLSELDIKSFDNIEIATSSKLNR